MSKVKDNRAVDFEFVKDFLSGNPLAKVLEYVKDSKNELILCFRGNSGNVITIYKKNHVFWEITKLTRSKNNYRIRFNFNHARYSEDWEKYLEALKSLGWKVERTSSAKYENDVNVGYIKYDFNALEDKVLEDSYTIINTAVKDYFDKNKKYDYFKMKNKNGKGILLEKQRQQELFEQYNKPVSGDGYFIYDLEFLEKGNRIGNQPDFWAVKYEDDKPRKLVLGEIKSKRSAMSGDSGIIEHLECMEAYIKGDYINNRKQEAIDILKRYALLGLYGLNNEDFKMLGNTVLEDEVEILVVLTDEAIDFYETEWKDIVENKFPNIKIHKYTVETSTELDKDAFDNIILSNAIERFGKEKFGYNAKNGRVYKAYYTNDEFTIFKTEMTAEHFKSFDEGKGNEFKETSIPPKMASVASSSRFCYLALRKGAEALGGTDEVSFECGCKIKNAGTPQLDAHIAKENIYVEAKCHEIFDEKTEVMPKYYWKYIYGKYEGIGFDLPKDGVDGCVGKEFNVPFQKFGLVDKNTPFDLKQFLCHLLGIACQKKSATLAYLFFKPKNETRQKEIDVVFEKLQKEIKTVFGNEYIQQFCKANNITLKAYAEFSEVMEELTKENILILYP